MIDLYIFDNMSVISEILYMSLISKTDRNSNGQLTKQHSV